MGTRAPRLSSCVVLLLAAAFLLVPAPAALSQPPTIATDPLLLPPVQQAILTASGGMDLDGDTAVIGATVFTRSGTDWAEQGALTPVDTVPAEGYGISAAVDGDTAVVGAWLSDVGGRKDQGTVYVFTRSGTTWSQQARLTASDANYFGHAVAVDGDTLLVGSPSTKVGENQSQGAGYVYTRTGAEWSLQRELTASQGAADDTFGYCVSLDGDTAIAGAPNAIIDGAIEQGAAYVYARSGGDWSEQARLVAADGMTGDVFGWSVAVDGDTALVGAVGVDSPGGVDEEWGAAYVFARDGSGWSQQARLAPVDGTAGDRFGRAVALDGDSALVGAPQHAVDSSIEQGTAYLFNRNGTTWSQRAALTTAVATPRARIGWRVAIDEKLAFAGNAQTISIFGMPCSVTPSVVGSHGAIRPAVASEYAYASTPTFSFAPAPGYGVAQVLVDAAPVSMTAADRYTLPALTADHTISVEFAPKPVLSRLSPVSGKRGATVTLRGRWFGDERGRSVVAFGSAKVRKYVSWSPRTIEVKVPGKARHGKVKVTVTTTTGASVARKFTVLR